MKLIFIATVLIISILIISPASIFAAKEHSINPLPPEHAEEFKIYRQKLREARENVIKLTEEAYENDPILKTCQEEYDRWDYYYHKKIGDLKAKSGRYLSKLRKENSKRSNDFGLLKYWWNQLNAIEYLKDPLRESVLKILLVQKNKNAIISEDINNWEAAGIDVSGLDVSDVDELWRTYKIYMNTFMEVKAKKNIEKIEARSNYPDFVKASAKTSAEGELNLMLYRHLVLEHTPKRLTDARDSVKNTIKKLNSLWPDWYKAELLAEREKKHDPNQQ
jgi:hypothetical protein